MHPRIRMPLWAAVALPAAAYVLRSVSRGFDFRPDLPADPIVFGALCLIVLLVAITRSQAAADLHDDLPAEVDRERDSRSGDR